MQASLVITAASTITPYGLGVGAFVQGSAAGPVACAPLAGAYAGQPDAAMVPKYDARVLLATRVISNFDRLTLHVCAALGQLYKSIGLDDPERRQAALHDQRVSFVCGTSGPLQSIFNIDLQAIEEPGYLKPSLFPNLVFNAPASYAAIRHGIRGSCITLTEGDTSSLQAFGVAAAQLRSGRIEFALVGGAEEASPAYALYRSALAPVAGEPERALAEGATLFGIERREHAERAGRASLASVLASTHVFSPDDTGAGINACLARLRRQAGRAVDEVGVVFAERSIALDGCALDGVRRVAFGARLGEPGAMYGVLAVLEVLTRADIAAGEHVLLLQVGREGACAALLLQKHRHLEA